MDPRRDHPGLLEAAQFERVREMAYDRFGLSIHEKKLSMIYNRLVRLQRQVGAQSIEDLIEHFERASTQEELLPLFDALSTNLTMFYREAEHFEILRRELVAPLGELPKEKRRLRLWSAGCSKGCEPYTMAMVAKDEWGEVEGTDLRILATDLSTSELEVAHRGIYPERYGEELGEDHIDRHFRRGMHASGRALQVREDLRSVVRLALLNLMDPWPMSGPFDGIYCRNVMIYFDEPTRVALVDRFTKILRTGGFLFLGTSEGLPAESPNLVRIGPSAYRKS